MKLQIKTLSPVHIGNGEKYNGLSYIQDKRSSPVKLCYLEFDTIKSVLSAQQLQNFADWITTERFPSIFKFLRNINDRNNTTANNLISKALYKIDLLFKEDPHQRIFLGDIDSFLKQNNKPYIPGTEIKGAIRTAVAYKLLQSDGYWSWLRNELSNFQTKFKNSFALLSTCGKKGRDFLTIAELKRIPNIEFETLFGKKRGYEIAQKISKGKDPEITVNKIKEPLVKEVGKIEEGMQNILFRPNGKNDAKYDLLKLLMIGDSELKEPSHCLFVSDLKTLNISETFSIFQEFCKKDQTFTCDFRLENNRIIVDKLGFNNEQKEVVSNVENLFQCCYEFSKRLLEEEIAYPHYPPPVKDIIKDKLAEIKKQNEPHSPVIRIGKNEGYLSLTMGLVVKDKDKTLYDNVLCHATKNTSYTGNFPKTRRVVNLGNNDMDTCGWVKLSIV